MEFSVWFSFCSRLLRGRASGPQHSTRILEYSQPKASFQYRPISKFAQTTHLMAVPLLLFDLHNKASSGLRWDSPAVFEFPSQIKENIVKYNKRPYLQSAPQPPNLLIWWAELNSRSFLPHLLPPLVQLESGLCSMRTFLLDSLRFLLNPSKSLCKEFAGLERHLSGPSSVPSPPLSRSCLSFQKQLIGHR